MVKCGVISQQSVSSQSSGSDAERRIAALPSSRSGEQNTRALFSLEEQLEKQQQELKEKDQEIAELEKKNLQIQTEKINSIKQQREENDTLNAALQAARATSRSEIEKGAERETKHLKEIAKWRGRFRECQEERDLFQKELFEQQGVNRSLEDQVLDPRGKLDTFQGADIHSIPRSHKQRQHPSLEKYEAKCQKAKDELEKLNELKEERTMIEQELGDFQRKLKQAERKIEKTRESGRHENDPQTSKTLRALNRRIERCGRELKELDERTDWNDVDNRAKLLLQEITQWESRMSSIRPDFIRRDSKDQGDQYESEEVQTGTGDGEEHPAYSDSVPGSTTGPTASVTESSLDAVPYVHPTLPVPTAPEAKFRAASPANRRPAIEPTTRPSKPGERSETATSRPSTGKEKKPRKKAPETAGASQDSGERSQSQKHSKSADQRRARRSQLEH